MTTIDVSLPHTRPGPSSDIRDCLAELEEKRRRQLDKLPDDRLDEVDMAHRASVVQIVEELSIARERLETGLYGICAGCDEAIDPDRLEFRPWATRCTACS
jgi:DnaK suppressor protein